MHIRPPRRAGLSRRVPKRHSFVSHLVSYSLSHFFRLFCPPSRLCKNKPMAGYSSRKSASPGAKPQVFGRRMLPQGPQNGTVGGTVRGTVGGTDFGAHFCAFLVCLAASAHELDVSSVQ